MFKLEITAVRPWGHETETFEFVTEADLARAVAAAKAGATPDPYSGRRVEVERMYIVYDARALLMGTDEASVMAALPDKCEAIKLAPDYGPCVVYGYDVADEQLANESLEWQDPRLGQPARNSG